MRIKGIAVCLVTALFTITLCGCQLAREELGEATGRDRLVGLFVTKEYLDLFDMEAYLNDHVSDIMAGKTALQGENTAQYQQRLYATLEKTTLVDEQTGESVSHEQYVFPGIEGIALFEALVEPTDGGERYHTSIVGEGMNDCKFSVGSETILEGTIYVAPKKGSITYYFNPVYQSGDGGVYLTAGTGLSMSGDNSPGISSSHTVEETQTITMDGETRTQHTKVAVTVCVMDPPEKIAVLQMAGDHSIIAGDTYRPGAAPQEIVMNEDVQYLIVEYYGAQGEPRRELIGRDQQQWITLYQAQEDGLCLARTIELVWGNQ